MYTVCMYYCQSECRIFFYLLFPVLIPPKMYPGGKNISCLVRRFICLGVSLRSMFLTHDFISSFFPLFVLLVRQLKKYPNGKGILLNVSSTAAPVCVNGQRVCNVMLFFTVFLLFKSPNKTCPERSQFDVYKDFFIRRSTCT